MVKTFHLHNCGNSRDFCEFTFLYGGVQCAATAEKILFFNHLQPTLSVRLWHFRCSQRTSSTVLKGAQWRVNFLRHKNWCPPLNSGKPPASASRSRYFFGALMLWEQASSS